jgi:hypothetical protein
VLKHLDDIESDLSAIHRIRNMWAMEARRFYRYVWRLPAYQGALRAVAERQARDEQERKEALGLADKEIIPVGTGELDKLGIAFERAA